MPDIHWGTVPPGVNLADAWEMYDETVEGWVPVWFPTIDRGTGRSYDEFERALLFNDNLGKDLKGHESLAVVGFSDTEKKGGCFCAVAIIL